VIFLAKLTKSQQKRLLIDAQKKILKVWQANFGIVRHFSPAMKDKLAKMCTDLDGPIDKLK
tara:strand:- start:1162 stop:1344 length:183 start_codon:yes stop_codon:yes gene_type:complete